MKSGSVQCTKFKEELFLRWDTRVSMKKENPWKIHKAAQEPRFFRGKKKEMMRSKKSWVQMVSRSVQDFLSLSLSLVLLHTLILFMLPDFLSFSSLSQKYFFLERDFEPPTPETRRSQTRIFLYLLLIRGGINIEIVILCFGGNFLLICIFYFEAEGSLEKMGQNLGQEKNP